ncbi:MAG: hypothetical protein Q9190_002451 [Brigantiaea leucoxantha]
MASIPLHCNICPRHPNFSDISHLLTHVSSKGHLSNYFKAQVRGRRDEVIRRQLETYDCWFEQHQIEKLLSQRMVLKDSKRPNGLPAKHRGDSIQSKPKTAKATKRSEQDRPVNGSRYGRNKSQRDDLIDPRLVLEEADCNQTRGTKGRRCSSTCDLAALNRSFVPRMRSFLVPSLSTPAASPLTARRVASMISQKYETISDRSSDRRTESENEHSLERSPVKSVYPDPSIIQMLRPREPECRYLSPTKCSIQPADIQRVDNQEVEHGNTFLQPSPELKGICYPGMSIFDSASPEAQRKRNQKKNPSILEQIERESMEVEQVEHIFWPDGTLKQSRIITGEAQSSPFKEDHAPPAKRRRKSSSGRVVHRARRGVIRPDFLVDSCQGSMSHNSHPADLQDLSKRSIAMLDNSFGFYSGQRYHDVKEEDFGWLLEIGDQSALSRRSFAPHDEGKALEPSISEIVSGGSLHSQGLNFQQPCQRTEHSYPAIDDYDCQLFTAFQHDPSRAINLSPQMPDSCDAPLSANPCSTSLARKEGEPQRKAGSVSGKASTRFERQRKSPQPSSIPRHHPPHFSSLFASHLALGESPVAIGPDRAVSPLDPDGYKLQSTQHDTQILHPQRFNSHYSPTQSSGTTDSPPPPWGTSPNYHIYTRNDSSPSLGSIA